MAKLVNSNHMLYIAILIIILGSQAYGVPYDDSITLDCLTKPPSAQYSGGMVMNAELNEGLIGWTAHGDAKIAHVLSDDGNKFIVAYERNQSFHSITQNFHLEEDTIYTFSAWVQVTGEEAEVVAVFKTKTGYEVAARASTRMGCWTMLKGGLVPKISGPTQLYFETESKGDVWADSISLQPFSHDEWKSHQNQKIQKVRQQKLRIQAVDLNGRPIPNATVSLRQTRRKFPFGCAINKNILYSRKYQKWFLERFNCATFENELKWYSTETVQGFVDYTIPDRMMRFARANKIDIRGHNILWEDPKYQPYWVPGLSPSELKKAVYNRITSVMLRYKGQLIHWDVMNENLHSDFFESRLNNKQASSHFYDLARRLDRRATTFLNDFNTIEDATDSKSSPYMYKKKIQDMRAHGFKGRLGIGLEAHFKYERVNFAYIRSSLEYLCQLGLPVWITELDLTNGPNQAWYLYRILRELHSHKCVRGIVMWASLGPNGCYAMCLTDYNYNNLATGYVVDKFIGELKHAGELDSPATTDSNGFFEASLYHGDYEVQVVHPNGNRGLSPRLIKVAHERKGANVSRVHRFTLDVGN